MHIFVLVAGLTNDEENAIRELARHGLSRLFQKELDIQQPEIKFQRYERMILVTAEKESRDFPRTRWLSGRQYDLLYFGDECSDTCRWTFAGEEAQTVTAAAQAIRAQDDCFGAALVGRAAPHLHLFSDITGQRRLRYGFRADGTLVVSSHDVGLAAMGALERRADLHSLASVARHGWSLGAHPLLHGGTAAPPYALTSFAPAAGGGARSRRFTVTTTRLPDPAADLDVPAHELLLEDFAARIGPTCRLRVHLTAGWDSRAALAAAFAVREAGAVETWVEGPVDCLDVRRARALAARLGLAFSHRELPTLSTEAFRFHLSRSCVAANGVIETYILPSNAVAPPSPALGVHGGGGEIHRGFYYPYRPFAHLTNCPYGSARFALRRRFCKTNTSSELRDRLDDVIDNLECVSNSQQEILDRFYATERFGVWAASARLDSSGARSASPFDSRRLMRRAFATTTTRGFDYTLHRELIRRFTPQLLDLPFNEDAFARGRPTTVRRKAWDETLAFAAFLRRRRARAGGRRAGAGARAGTGEERKENVEAAVAELLADEPELFAEVDATAFGVADEGLPAATTRRHLAALRFLKICFNLIEEARRVERA